MGSVPGSLVASGGCWGCEEAGLSNKRATTFFVSERFLGSQCHRGAGAHGARLGVAGRSLSPAAKGRDVGGWSSEVVGRVVAMDVLFVLSLLRAVRTGKGSRC